MFRTFLHIKYNFSSKQDKGVVGRGV